MLGAKRLLLHRQRAFAERLRRTSPMFNMRRREFITLLGGAAADPISSGFVESLVRPGGNLTGFLLYEESITGKWLAMLKEIAPAVTRAAIVSNPKTVPYDYFLHGAESAAPSLGLQIVPGRVENTADIERTIESLAQVPDGGMILPPDTTTVVTRSDHRTCGQTPVTCDLFPPYFRRGRGSHVLWH
jgi:hypothetical protein